MNKDADWLKTFLALAAQNAWVSQKVHFTVTEARKQVVQAAVLLEGEKFLGTSLGRPLEPEADEETMRLIPEMVSNELSTRGTEGEVSTKVHCCGPEYHDPPSWCSCPPHWIFVSRTGYCVAHEHLHRDRYSSRYRQ